MANADPYLIQKATEDLEKNNLELWACIQNTTEAWNQLAAATKLRAPGLDEWRYKDLLAFGEAMLYSLITDGTMRLALRTPEFEEQLEQLHKRVQAGPFADLLPPPQATAATAAADAVPDEFAAVVADFKNLSSGDFRRVWGKPDKVGIYQRACESGRI
jgi:hypothetical protein